MLPYRTAWVSRVFRNKALLYWLFFKRSIYPKFIMRNVNEIEQFEQKKFERKSRAKYQCPAELLDLIKKISLIRVDLVLPNWNVVFVRNERPYIAFDQNKDIYTRLEIWRKTNDECLSYLPNELRRNLIKDLIIERVAVDRLTPEILSDLKFEANRAKVYDEYRQNRENLQGIVSSLNTIKEFGLNRHPIPHTWGISGWLSQSEEDVVNLELGGATNLSEILCSINLARLRACKICNHIFWAKYKVSKTCSPICLNAWCQSEYREKNREKINADRVRNYQHKKKVEKIRKKKDGTL